MTGRFLIVELRYCGKSSVDPRMLKVLAASAVVVAVQKKGATRLTLVPLGYRDGVIGSRKPNACCSELKFAVQWNERP
jgi:hypothetical protein